MRLFLPLWLIVCRWFGYYFALVWKIDATSLTCECSCILCPNFENFCPNNGQFFSVGDATASPASLCRTLVLVLIPHLIHKYTSDYMTMHDQSPAFYPNEPSNLANGIYPVVGFKFFKNRFSHSKRINNRFLIITVSRGKPCWLARYKGKGWSLCCQLVQSSSENYWF